LSDNIILISDFFIDDFVGGAALNDEEIYTLLNRHYDVKKIKSRYLYPGFIEENTDSFFIISNFFGIQPHIRDFIQKKCKYILYCHDYKFVAHTNPATYSDFQVPLNELINLDFHWDAHKIVCQTKFQKDIYDKNVTGGPHSSKPVKTVNFSGNLWSEKDLSLLEELSNSKKNSKHVIVDSPYPQKGVQASVDYCENNKFNYDVIGDPDYHTFLKKLSSYSELVFFPYTPETCGRVALEAKMMGLEVKSNNLLGCSYENWYDLKSNDLINYMREKRDKFVDFMRPIIHEQSF